MKTHIRSICAQIHAEKIILQSELIKRIFVLIVISSFFLLLYSPTTLAQFEQDSVESSSENVDSTSTSQPVSENSETQIENSQIMDDLETNLEESFDINKALKEKKESKTPSMINPIRPPSLIDIHNALSDDVVGFSESVDTFFVNDRVIEGRNLTNVRILSSASSIEREGTGGDVAFRVRLKLPRLENMFQVEIDNLDNTFNLDSDPTTQATQNQTQGPAQTTNQNFGDNTSAGLSFFKDILGIQSKLSFRYLFSDSVPFGNWRVSKRFGITDKQALLFISDIFGDTKERTGQRTTIYYDIKTNQKDLLRFFNEATYRHENHTYRTVHGVGLYHIYTDRSSIAYIASVSALNPQTQSTFYAESYDVSATYRYRVYKRHVFLDVIPAVGFPKKYSFVSNWSATLRLEIIFGRVQ
jgi:hypothetical protein